MRPPRSGARVPRDVSAQACPWMGWCVRRPQTTAGQLPTPLARGRAVTQCLARLLALAVALFAGQPVAVPRALDITTKSMECDPLSVIAS